MGKLGPQLKYVGAAALLLVLAAPWLPVPPYWVTLLTYVGLSSIVAIGLVILTGAAGMTSLGQAAFVGIGAYCTAYVTTHLGYSPWIGLVASILVTGASAFLIGLFTMKLSGYYLPICTIAWGLALYYLFGNLEILGRHDGIIGIPSISLFGFELSSQASMHVFIWFFVAFSYITASNLLDSRMGRALRSLKFGLVMPEAMGVHTARLKVVLFVYAANLAGLSGWLYAHLQHAVSPTPFSLKYGVDYLVMVVVGGASEVAGALLGAGLVTLLGSVLQEWLPQLVGSTSNFEAIAFGILLVLILQHASDGIWPFIRARLGGRSSARAPAKAPLLSHRPPPAAEEVVLRVEHARKQFGGLVAVNDLSFQVRAGEIVGLIGPNGAGKSTIFNLITGVDEPTSGNISFRGKPVTHLPSREIAARGIARTFQHVRLVPGMSVLENVAVGCHLRGRRPQWVENLLQAVPTDWLRELVAFLPVGFEAFLSSMRLDRKREEKALFEAKRQVERVGLGDLMYEDAGSIALGHQRILEIARALCSDPTLLLLDEPAAGLRMHEKVALAELLKALRADGMAILLVEHDMGFVMQLTDHIVVVERGAKIAEGKPKEMYEHPAVREAYLGGAD